MGQLDKTNKSAPKKTKVNLIEWLLLLSPALFFLCYLGLKDSEFLQLFKPEERSGKQICRSYQSQLALAFALYGQDYDGKLPLHRTQVPTYGVGWADLITSYSKAQTLLICPSDPTVLKPKIRQPQFTDYTSFWFNSNLSGVKRSAIPFPSRTICLGDGNDGKDVSDATYSKTSIPPLWISDANSPANRHFGGANYLMVDGSVHWLKPQDVATFGGRKNAFATK